MKKILFLLLIATNLFSQQSPVLNTYKRVFDFESTGISSDNIEKKIKKFEDSSGCKLIVVTTGDYFGYGNSKDAILNLGRDNKVGSGYNGIIVLISKKNRHTEISVESKLSGILPDLVLSRIAKLGNPYFKSGDFTGGVSTIIDNLNSILTKKDSKEEIVSYKSQQINDNGDIIEIIYVILILLLILIGIIIYFYRRNQKKIEEEAKRLKEDEIFRREERIQSLTTYPQKSSPLVAGGNTSGIHPINEGGYKRTMDEHRWEKAAKEPVYPLTPKECFNPSRDDDKGSYTPSITSNNNDTSSSFSSDTGGSFDGGGGGSDW